MPDLIQKLKYPLYKNSFLIMLSSIINAGFGFFFWVFAARLYSAEDVGITSIILLSRLGSDFSLIRFFRTEIKPRFLV